MVIAAAAPSAANQLGWGAVGLVGLVVVWLAWSGQWRAWADDRMKFWLITVLPPTCTFILIYGATGFRRNGVVAVLALLATLWWVAGWVLFLVEPRWYGPRWYRERRREPLMDRTTASAQVLGGHVPPERNSEQLARDARSPEKPITRRRVLFVDPALGRPSALHTEGTAAGHLLIFRDELVFAADHGDDALRPGPTIRTLPASTITGIREGKGGGFVHGAIRQGQVHIDVADGEGWTIEPLRRDATLTDLRRTYLDGRAATS